MALKASTTIYAFAHFFSCMLIGLAIDPDLIFLSPQFKHIQEKKIKCVVKEILLSTSEVI